MVVLNRQKVTRGYKSSGAESSVETMCVRIISLISAAPLGQPTVGFKLVQVLTATRFLSKKTKNKKNRKKREKKGKALITAKDNSMKIPEVLKLMR